MSTLTRLTIAACAVIGCLPLQAEPPAVEQLKTGFDEQFPVDTWRPSGEVFVRRTSYPAPDDALFVSTDGNDSNNGSQSGPLRSIRTAVSRASSGQTIVIRSGSYREPIGSIVDKRLTLQPAAGEEVWILGSIPLNDRAWSLRNGKWQRRWESVLSPNADKEAIDPKFPLASSRYMAFRDGIGLREVATASKVTAGTFHVGDGRLTIGDDPARHLIEATVHATCCEIGRWGGDPGAAGTVIRGLGFKHWASGYNGREPGIAINDGVENVTIENCTFAWAAHAGLSVFGTGCTIRGNTLAFCGEYGLHVWHAHDTTFEHNAIVHNNVERFNTDWTAGGFKASRHERGIWRNNYVSDNLAHGMWWDISCAHCRIVSNVCRRNQGAAIFYELSSDAVIASNLCIDNLGGVSIRGGHRNLIYNNTIAGGGSGISIDDDPRQNSDGDPDWNTYGCEVVGNLISDLSDGPYLHVRDGVDRGPARDAATLVTKADHNVYHRHAARDPRVLITWWVNNREGRYTSLDTFRTATGFERNGLEVNRPGNLYFIGNGDYSLTDDSPAGAPLPPSILDAVGIPTGAKLKVGRLK